MNLIEHTCIKDDGGTPSRRCYACEFEKQPINLDDGSSNLSFPNHPVPLDSTPDESDHMLKQRLAAPARYYGGTGTIHATGHVDVETDKDGNVVSVWFRCQPLPFKQTKVAADRANEMRGMYASHAEDCKKNKRPFALTGVEIMD